MELARHTGEAHLYRLAHPLAEPVLAQAMTRSLDPAKLSFEFGKHDGKVSVVEPPVGKSGVLPLSLFTIDTSGQAEDYLISHGRHCTPHGHVVSSLVGESYLGHILINVVNHSSVAHWKKA